MNVDPRVQAIIDNVLVASPLGRQLGFELVSIQRDSIKLKLPFKAENVTVGTTIHGGAIAALIDTAGAIASVSGVDPDAQKGGATSNLTVNYLAPAEAIDLVASAQVVSRTRSQTVSDVSVHSPDGRLIAKALITARLF